MARRPLYTIEDGMKWRKMYEAGATFEQITNEDGRFPTMQTVRKWAIKAGCIPRPPQGPHHGVPRNLMRDGKGTAPAGRRVTTPMTHRGHRRRGRL